MTVIRFGLIALVLSIACGAPAASSSPSPAGGTSRQRDILTREEILNSPQQGLDLYQAILSLRPHFLEAPRGVRRASADPSTAVYIERTRQPGLVSLRSVLASTVEEVRYLDPMASQSLLGSVASSGAVMVTLHRQDKQPER